MRVDWTKYGGRLVVGKLLAIGTCQLRLMCGKGGVIYRLSGLSQLASRADPNPMDPDDNPSV